MDWPKSYNFQIYLFGLEKALVGGYAYVYKCEDTLDSNNIYALKYVFCQEISRLEVLKKEANYFSVLKHENIVQMIASKIEESDLAGFFLFEICPSSAISLIIKRSLTQKEIAIFFHSLCKAVSYMHSFNPPVFHRDLKPENLLVNSQGIVKLCDFGSATNIQYKDLPLEKIPMAEDDIMRNTSLPYCAPEMLDLYRNFLVGAPPDIWAIGCTLYKLIAREDLFSSEEKLAILNGRISFKISVDQPFKQIILDFTN